MGVCVVDLFYHRDPEGNFGDDMNLWFWDEVLPGWREAAPDVTLFGIGTLLNAARLAPFAGRRLLVLGSGVGYGDPPDLPLDPAWDIRALRGPVSARSLRLAPALGLIDPAMLLPQMPRFAGLSGQPRADRPLFVPHHESIGRHDWRHACTRAGLDFASPREEAHSVVRRIALAPLVVAESMHAAIIADAFRVPWVPVWASWQFNAGKWRDVFEALELEGAPQPLYGRLGELPFGQRLSRRGRLRHRLEASRLPRCLRRAAETPPLLSDGAHLQALTARFREALDGVRDAYFPPTRRAM